MRCERILSHNPVLRRAFHHDRWHLRSITTTTVPEIVLRVDNSVRLLRQSKLRCVLGPEHLSSTYLREEHDVKIE